MENQEKPTFKNTDLENTLKVVYALMGVKESELSETVVKMVKLAVYSGATTVLSVIPNKKLNNEQRIIELEKIAKQTTEFMEKELIELYKKAKQSENS